MTDITLSQPFSLSCDESMPMTSSSPHYQPVEGERLEFEPEIYRTDDTAQIFGDNSRIPIGLREILVDPRLNPSKRFFCCGAATSLIVILLVVLFFIVGGYFHVQNEIKERTDIAKNGLQLYPTLKSDGAWVMFLNLNRDANNYASEIQSIIDQYETEQSSRSNYTRECKPEDRPNGRAWCRFPTKKRFIRAGKGCTADDKYGYATRAPCLLILLKDRVGWFPKFKNDSRYSPPNNIPFKCSILDTFKLYDEHINVSYYPAHDLNANYGAFALNKMPSESIRTEKDEEISDDNGETLYDQPNLIFVKFSLPPTFRHGVVHCTLYTSLPGVEFTNLAEFRGNKEIRFDVLA